MPRLLRWALALGLLVSACNDEGSEDKGPSLEELPAELVQRLCAEVEACLDPQSIRIAFGSGGCEGRLTAQLEDGDFEHVIAGVEAGRIEYDASKVGACLATLEGIACEFANVRAFDDESCEQVLVGSANVGAECVVDEDCTGKAFCQRIDGACPGTCVALLGPGEPCEEDDQCEDGLACPDALGTCSAPAAEGDACGDSVGARCGAGFSCVGEDDDTGKAGECKDTGSLFAQAEGESCDYDSGTLCKTGLSCIVESIEANQPTLVCAKPVGSGEGCHFGAPSPCPNGEYCNADIGAGIIDGDCVPLPKAGEDCAAASGQRCADGLVCDIDQKCHPFARLGQSCVSDQGCASKRCEAGTCRRIESCELK